VRTVCDPQPGVGGAVGDLTGVIVAGHALDAVESAETAARACATAGAAGFDVGMATCAVLCARVVNGDARQGVGSWTWADDLELCDWGSSFLQEACAETHDAGSRSVRLRSRCGCRQSRREDRK
jgi:hypothetical protein